jgi:hypothetical protein
MKDLPYAVENDAQRLFLTIQRAAKQLEAVDAPGLVILDVEGDLGLHRQLTGTAKMLSSEPWARGVAGVAVMASFCTIDEASGEWWTGNVMTIVPGPMADALADTLLPGLRICDREHFHSDPLLVPPDRCPVFW